MGFFNNNQQTRQQKEQIRLNLRLLGCGVLGYSAVSMLMDRPDDGSVGPIFAVIIPIAFLAFAVIVGAMTLRQYFIIRRVRKQDAQNPATDNNANENADAPETDDEK